MDINQIANVSMPIIITGIAGILVKIIVPLGDMLIDYIKTKKDEAGVTQKLAQHQEEITTAKQIWNIVEEKYRITEKVEDLLVSKAKMFDDLLLKKIPYLTQDNLDDLRQAIAGEFNKGKQSVITDDTLKQSNIDLQNSNTQLTTQNNDLVNTNQVLQNQVNDLQNKLNTINSALSSNNETNNTQAQQ